MFFVSRSLMADHQFMLVSQDVPVSGLCHSDPEDHMPPLCKLSSQAQHLLLFREDGHLPNSFIVGICEHLVLCHWTGSRWGGGWRLSEIRREAAATEHCRLNPEQKICHSNPANYVFTPCDLYSKVVIPLNLTDFLEASSAHSHL